MARRSGPRGVLGARGVVPLLVLPVALLALAACAQTPTPLPGTETPASDGPVAPGFEPIVFQNPQARAGAENERVRERAPLDPSEAGWTEKLELARGYAHGGFEEEALTVIQAALQQSPPPAVAERFRQLRTSLRVRRAETDLLRADARGARDYVAFSVDVSWRVRLRNVSRETLVIPAPASDQVSPAAVTLTIVRRDLDVYGVEVRRRWTQTVFLHPPGGRDITIPPAGTLELEATLPAEDVGGPITGLRILEVAGTLRLPRLRRGEREESATLPVRRGRVVALPGGYEPLALDPLGSMTRAIEAVAPAHLLIAAEFVRRDAGAAAARTLAQALAEGDPALRKASVNALVLLRDRLVGQPLATLVDPLATALERRPQREDALIEGLGAVTGQSLPPDGRLWLEWWRRTRPERQAVAPREGEGESLGEGS